MSNYDPYEREYTRRVVREDRRQDREPAYLDPREHLRPYPSRDLVPRAREDSDLSIEEVRREFPPPSGRDIRRARSAEPEYYDDDYDYRRGYDRRDYDRRDYDRRPAPRRSPGSTYIEEEERKVKSKGMSKEEKIIAAVAGAALLVGGKELYDRREAKGSGSKVQRNALSSAALAGVGALAAYQGAEFYSKQQAKKDQKATYILHRGRDGHITEYYSDEEDGSKEKKGNKNFLESALAATGLGAAVKSLTGGGGDDDKRSDTRSRRGGSPDSRASSPGRTRSANKVQKAAMASLLAGATEAFRVSKEPGGWKGEKTKRILTAAAGAATVDAAQKDDHGKMGLMESVLGGLVGNRLINGSKNNIEEDKRTGRSRSRSRARSSGGGGATGLAALATAGLGAFGAKKALENRSRSRSRRGSYDSRSPSPDRRRQRSRSRSVVDKARNSLAKLGIGSGAAGAGAVAAHEHGRRDQDDYDDRGSRRSRRYSDEYDDDRSYYTGRSDRDRDRDHDYDRDRDYDRPRRKGGRSDYGSETDLGDSSEDEKRAKKMKGKLALTTGLAAVATIHAAHGVYQSMEKRSARQKAVTEGRLSPAEAKKLKTKAIMQDAASVGIAALGIKGAVGELKSARQISKECKEFKQEKVRRHEKRLERRRQSAPGSRRRADSWDSYPRSPYDGYDADDDYGPRYFDDNPYGAARLPAPPVGRGR
jgi:hypothetical protein